MACPKCGPRLRWLDPQGHELACGDDAVGRAVAMLRAGGVLAVKGLGGYQLMVAARPDQAVLALRQRKHREEKPFALMFPNLEMVREACYADEMEERVLASPEGPIVLLRQRRESNTGISPLVAPGLVEWGVMLPTTPLHHLILHDFGGPVVATSGNLSDEPICTEEEEALARLGPLVDGLLVHDRPVVRPVDDSVVRVLLGREMVLRRARGYAPWPVPSGSREGDPVVLAVGADLKNTVALGRGPDIVVGQHVGDLGTELSFRAQQRSIEDLPRLLDAVPEIAACDLHPDYHSRRAAERTGLPMRPVQHHLAHALACLAENEVDPPALAVTWDGTGFGTDGTIWGGEFLLVEKKRWRRLAHLRPFPLVGGDGAAREPRRAALGLLHALFGEDLWNRADLPTIRAFTVVEMRVLRTLLDGRRQTVPTTSMGRFLDALASLCDVRHVSTFEAQTAMDFEACAATATPEETLTLPDLDLVAGAGESPWSLDWAPLVAEVVRVREQAAPTLIAEAVHRALVRSVLAVARRAGIPEVALTGGCFQNRILLEGTVADLRAEGFRPCWPQRIPPNDGGISLGQVVAVRSGHA